MRIEEHAFPEGGGEGDGEGIDHPEYLVEFWDLTDYSIASTRITDAVDVQEVEVWAHSQSPDHYTIYCAVRVSPNAWKYARVSGFGPDVGTDPADYLSDSEKVRRVRAIPGLEDLPPQRHLTPAERK